MQTKKGVHMFHLNKIYGEPIIVCSKKENFSAKTLWFVKRNRTLVDS